MALTERQVRRAADASTIKLEVRQVRGARGKLEGRLRSRQEGRQTNGPSLSFLIFNICLKISARSTRPLLPNLNTAEIHCRTAGSWRSSAIVPSGPVLPAARPLLAPCPLPAPARPLIVSLCLLLHNYLLSFRSYFSPIIVQFYSHSISFSFLPSIHTSLWNPFLMITFCLFTWETPLFTLSLIGSHYAVFWPIVSHVDPRLLLLALALRSTCRTRLQPTPCVTFQWTANCSSLPGAAGSSRPRLPGGAQHEADYYLRVS